jgi:hypothetical protein
LADLQAAFVIEAAILAEIESLRATTQQYDQERRARQEKYQEECKQISTQDDGVRRRYFRVENTI